MADAIFIAAETASKQANALRQEPDITDAWFTRVYKRQCLIGYRVGGVTKQGIRFYISEEQVA